MDVTERAPAEVKAIFSVAVSLEPTLNDILAALLSAAKLPSEITSIAPATNIASVPVPSSGALNLILPSTSLA